MLNKRRIAVSARPSRSSKTRPNDTSRITAHVRAPAGYQDVLANITQWIEQSRRRALAAVNRELVYLYWNIGRVITRRQETASWGDAVVERLSQDLRAAFPDIKGLTKDNLFRMRKFYQGCLAIDEWLLESPAAHSIAMTPARILKNVGAAPPQIPTRQHGEEKVGSPTPQLRDTALLHVLASLSWTHLTMIYGACEPPEERYFYMQMAIRERWSVRELRRQVDADLFVRYVSASSNPDKCLPVEAESGDLLPFKDHYVLEFLGLEDGHSELELRKAILANLRDFFLEFGKDLAFVGDEYPLTIGGDTFFIDLLFFHRRLRCLIALELKRGKFKPEYAGKSRFYCAALDEFMKLPDEAPSLGLVLCRGADAVQVRLALTDAAKRIGIATYQTALPDERLIRQRVEQLPQLPEDNE
jgi:predicted nuclease of restriction endonuclease-like (RecB) superfamily